MAPHAKAIASQRTMLNFNTLPHSLRYAGKIRSVVKCLTNSADRDRTASTLLTVAQSFFPAPYQTMYADSCESHRDLDGFAVAQFTNGVSIAEDQSREGPNDNVANVGWLCSFDHYDPTSPHGFGVESNR